jgi:hypothetical protein
VSNAYSPPLALAQASDAAIITGFGRPFGLGQDSDGRLHVADMDLHAIGRLEPDLGAVAWLGIAGDGWSEPLPLQHGIASRQPPRVPGRFNGPHSVALGLDGRMYVVTYYAPALHIMAPDGSHIRRIGAPAVPMRLEGPASGHFDRRRRLLVTEYALHGVFAFDADGEFLGGLGGGDGGFAPTMSFLADSRRGAFDRPHMCRAAADGTLIVADTWNHRLQRFTPEGGFIAWLGSGGAGWRDDDPPPAQGREPGAFSAPVAVGFAPDGRMVVTDWGNNRLQWFTPGGQLMAINDALGLDRPYDAQVFGSTLAIADSHHGRVLLRRI